MQETTGVREWMDRVIKPEEIEKYLINGRDFIDTEKIEKQLAGGVNPDPKYIRDIIAKSLDIQRLDPEETAALINVTDPELLQEMFEAGGRVKKEVYDNRIVTFAPLYCGNLCVNSCLYCGFRHENKAEKRQFLQMDKIRKEAEALASIGHKRLIVVYGEHPATDADYIAESIRTIYDVKVKARKGTGSIRRVNVNAAPMCVNDLKKLWEAGIGTYQVFQETYHKDTYKTVHPSGPKADYRWRLYALHRAMDAGIDDVATGSLFGLYDWRFEVMGLLYHAIDLETHFGGIGPHTISFPRLNAAEGSPYADNPQHRVNDEDFKKLVSILRLSVPYTGLIVTARETAELRREVIPLGCTQTDASTKIGIGSYSEQYTEQEKDRQQFMLGDTRSLDEVIREFAEMGLITSFCTAGYRCGRTGDKIMGLLKKKTEAKFCKLNAVLTFREWLDDYASPETKAAGEKIIQKEIDEIRDMDFYKQSKLLQIFEDSYEKIEEGDRDIFI